MMTFLMVCGGILMLSATFALFAISAYFLSKACVVLAEGSTRLKKPSKQGGDGNDE